VILTSVIYVRASASACVCPNTNSPVYIFAGGRARVRVLTRNKTSGARGAYNDLCGFVLIIFQSRRPLAAARTTADTRARSRRPFSPVRRPRARYFLPRSARTLLSAAGPLRFIPRPTDDDRNDRRPGTGRGGTFFSRRRIRHSNR